MNYYNDYDKGAAAWLRELIKAGHIPPGYVDERSITEITAGDLAGFTQCHFFCGIGGWPLALQLAGVPATVPLWTGSPPCQPFSVAGAGAGKRDARHLAPAFLDLVAECRPQLIFGEQVAAAVKKDQWADSLLIELEEEGYTSGFAVLPACSVGAPHKRDRLFFGASLGYTNSQRHYGVDTLLRQDEKQRGSGNIPQASWAGKVSKLANTDSQQQRPGGFRGTCADDVPSGREQDTAAAAGFRSDSVLADTLREQFDGSGPSGQGGRVQYANIGDASSVADASDSTEQPSESRPTEWGLPQGIGEDAAVRANPHHGFWSDADWLGCRDGKFRPVEPGTFPLVDGLSRSLDVMRTIETDFLSEVNKYAYENKKRPGQILSALREMLQQEARREREPTGMLFELHEAKILLSFLLCICATRETGTVAGSFTKKNDANCRSFLRSLRTYGKFSGTSRRWESTEPRSDQPADFMFTLSFLLARYVTPYQQAALDAHASAGRVAMLRGFGNAIVPEVAAQFVKAFRSALEDVCDA